MKEIFSGLESAQEFWLSYASRNEIQFKSCCYSLLNIFMLSSLFK